MTDQEVLQVLDQLEGILSAPLELPNAKAVAEWHEAFRRAAAAAERGPRWPEVQVRAKVLGVLLSRRVALIQDAQKTLKLRLDKVATGRRAIAAYRGR
jgi:hypothetical protein